MSAPGRPKRESLSAQREGSQSGAPQPGPQNVPLRRLAHGRSGDKGDRSNISVIAWRPEFFPLLTAQVTEAAVAALFVHRRPSRVQRFLLPQLAAMNFVLDGALDGGVNDALNLDSHGKALSFLLLELPIDLPPELTAMLPDHGTI